MQCDTKLGGLRIEPVSLYDENRIASDVCIIAGFLYYCELETYRTLFERNELETYPADGGHKRQLF